MMKTQNSKLRTKNYRRRGMAMLVVLFVVIAIVTVASGILYRADMAMAGGQNYAQRTQADYVAWAGLEYARALILADPNTPKPQTGTDGGGIFSPFLYTITIAPSAVSHEFPVTSVSYYKTEDKTRSALTATVVYDPNGPKAWFTNIQRQ